MTGLVTVWDLNTSYTELSCYCRSRAASHVPDRGGRVERFTGKQEMGMAQLVTSCPPRAPIANTHSSQHVYSLL